MYLSVQLAARRLGVSPHTIRRWTASGLLPCTRTAGGHRRIKQEDVDELAHLIGGRNHLATRLARERELDLLLEAAESLGVRAPEDDGLARLARCAAALFEASGAFVWGVDRAGEQATLLAAHGTGRRLHRAGRFVLAQAPAACRALAARETVAVRTGDPHADPADAALLRRDGDGSVLIAPVLAGGTSLGLVEVRDRGERAFTRHEVRLAEALAALAGSAIERDRLRQCVCRRDAEVEALRSAVERIGHGLAAVHSDTVHDALQAAAGLAAEALGGVACVADRGSATAGAVSRERGAGEGTAAAYVLTAASGEGDERVVLTLTLDRPATAGQTELLRLVAAAAAVAAAAVSSATRA